MLETISDLEESKKKSGGLKSGGTVGSKQKTQSKYYFPKKIVVGNKKDLAKNKAAGSITQDDIKRIDGIKIKEVSSLTNHGISEVLKTLVTDMNNDRSIDAA